MIVVCTTRRCETNSFIWRFSNRFIGYFSSKVFWKPCRAELCKLCIGFHNIILIRVRFSWEEKSVSWWQRIARSNFHDYIACQDRSGIDLSGFSNIWTVSISWFFFYLKKAIKRLNYYYGGWLVEAFWPAPGRHYFTSSYLLISFQTKCICHVSERGWIVCSILVCQEAS